MSETFAAPRCCLVMVMVGFLVVIKWHGRVVDLLRKEIRPTAYYLAHEKRIAAGAYVPGVRTKLGERSFMNVPSAGTNFLHSSVPNGMIIGFEISLKTFVCYFDDRSTFSDSVLF